MTKKVKTIRPTIFEDIPVPVMYDILSRLTAKESLNCKLVRQEWYHIITDRKFTDFRRSLSYYFTLILFGKMNNGKINFMLIDINKSSKVDESGNLDASLIKFKATFGTPNHKIAMINQCDGLICLKSWESQWGPFIVCNLLTGELVFIEQQPPQPTKPQWSFVANGFGYCSVLRQHKILRILRSKETYVTQIHTVGTNEWRTVNDAPTTIAPRWGTVAYLNDSLHGYSSQDNCIWSFHFGNEQFSRISVPDDLPNAMNRLLDNKEVSVYKNRLCISAMTTILRQCEIWMMNEYGVEESWVKLYVFETEYLSQPVVPVLEMENGEILVTSTNGRGLGVCDVESREWKRVQVPNISNFRVMECDTKFARFE